MRSVVLICTLAALAMGGCLSSGCAELLSPMSRTMEVCMEKVVQPTMLKLADNMHNLSGQATGSVQGIDPGYEVKGHVYWVGAGIDYEGTIRMIGVAGQISGAMQSAPAADKPDKPDKPVIFSGASDEEILEWAKPYRDSVTP